MKAKLLLLLTIVATSCTPGISDADIKQLTKTIDSVAKTKPKPKPVAKANWRYEDEIDKMDNETAYYATCQATNLLQFDFPYDGGSRGGIIVRNKKGKAGFLIVINKGQFIGGYNDETVRIKFDDEKPMSVGYGVPSDGSRDVIFLNNAKKLIEKVKKAKHVMVEVEFYDAGKQTMEFNTEGLDWKH